LHFQPGQLAGRALAAHYRPPIATEVAFSAMGVTSWLGRLLAPVSVDSTGAGALALPDDTLDMIDRPGWADRHGWTDTRQGII
jgi:hypothetical protein